MTATLGDGAFTFRALEDWANLPAEIELGDVVSTDWREVFSDQAMPQRLRRFQKFERVGVA